MLHLQGISKQYGSKVLFEDAEAHINHRSRVALIGPNGSGKSTLIKMILNTESPDTGKVIRASHLAIGHLAQEVPKFSGRTVIEEVMRLDGRRDELLEARVEIETILGEQGNDTSEAVLERYGRILEELDHLDEYRLKSRAEEILMGMGFKVTDFERNLTEFSGGWLMRVALSRVLLMDPDLLLLDEPTNHLDLESLLWLEEFLGNYQGALLLVSHDRAFLNRMVNEVLEIDQRKVMSYRGNLDAFALQKQERLTVLRSQYAGQQAKIEELEDFVRRFGAKATKARQAQSRVKQLERMEEEGLIELPDEKSTVRFRFPPAPHSGKEVVTAKALGLNYGPKKVFQGLDWVIRRGSRVAIVGVNGAGKTTLLRLLSGALEPSNGEIRYGHEVKIGYYAQHQAESLRMNFSVLQELEDTAPHLQISQVRGVAGAFLFSGDAVEKKCGVLSGGEKARVALAKLLLTPSNFLLLDEPTNHLDADSREVLLEALRGYQGTLCLVSHDREFVSGLVDAVLEILPGPGGSEVLHLIGTYQDYVDRKVREARERPNTQLKPAAAAAPAPAAAKKSPEPAAAPLQPQAGGPSNNQRRNWERERTKVEAEISAHEKEQAALQATFADPATYEDKPKMLALQEAQRKLTEALHAKLARWEELSGYLGG